MRSALLHDRALQDRPTSAALPRPARRRGAALLAAAVVFGGLAVVGADRALDALPGFGLPFEEQVVDRSRPALLQSLADLDDFHAAKGTFQVVVDLERDVRYLPALVAGERTTYLAVGSVDALVDFGGLSGDAVRTDGTSATLTLPAPTLDEARLDLAESRVLDRDRGVVDRLAGALGDEPTSDRDVALLAEDEAGGGRRRERPADPRRGQHPRDAHRAGRLVRLRRRHRGLRGRRPAPEAGRPVRRLGDWPA